MLHIYLIHNRELSNLNDYSPLPSTNNNNNYYFNVLTLICDHSGKIQFKFLD